MKRKGNSTLLDPDDPSKRKTHKMKDEVNEFPVYTVKSLP